MKRDVGMACQKITQGWKDIKVKVNTQNPIPASFSHNCSVRDVGMDEALHIYLHFYTLPCGKYMSIADHRIPERGRLDAQKKLLVYL